MTVLKTRLEKTLKNTTLLLLTSVLIACQAETSVSADAQEIEKTASAVEHVSAAIEEVKEPIQEVVEEKAPTQQIVQATIPEISEAIPETTPVKPTPPVDFSKLDSNKYKPVSEPFAVSSADKIEVIELFWFGCGHCFALEPHLKNWIKNKPANAKFKKVPAIFSKRWEFHAKAFYTIESLDMPEQTYDDFFSQIHIQKKPIDDLNALVIFLSRFDKDKTTVENAFNSFAVDSKIRNAIKIPRASGARGVPAMVVDGRYLTSQSDAGSTSEMFEVVDQLVAKSASER